MLLILISYLFSSITFLISTFFFSVLSIKVRIMIMLILIVIETRKITQEFKNSEILNAMNVIIKFNIKTLLIFS